MMRDRRWTKFVRGGAIIVCVACLSIANLLLSLVAIYVMVILEDSVPEGQRRLADAIDDHPRETEYWRELYGLNRRPLSDGDPLIDRRMIYWSGYFYTTASSDIVQRLGYMSEKHPDLPVDLYLTTLGGSSDDTFAVVDFIDGLTFPVNTYALGRCSSAGVMIVAAGTGTRNAYPNTLFGIHLILPAEDEIDDNSNIRKNHVIDFWKRHANLPEEWLETEGDTTWYITAKQALEYGIVDEIIEPGEREAE